LQDLADTRKRVSGLQENPVRLHMVAEDWHESCEKGFVIAFVLREDGLKISWKVRKHGRSVIVPLRRDDQDDARLCRLCNQGREAVQLDPAVSHGDAKS
jgi:hypothetical protein